MNLIFRLFLIFFFCNSQATTLEQVYSLAEQNDSIFQASLEQHKATQELENQAFSYLLPNIRATAAKNNTKTETTDYNNTNLSLNLSQPIYNKATLHGLEQVKYKIKESSLALKLAQQNLMIKVVNLYFDVVSSKDALETYKLELSLIKSQLNNIKQKFNLGLVPKTDLLESQAQKDLSISKVLSAETELLIAIEKLSEVIDSTDYNTQKLPSTTPFPVPVGNVDYWEQLALKNNLSIKIKRMSSDSARENINVQRAGHFPIIELTASATDLDSDNANVQDGRTDTIGLSLTLPLFSGGLTNSKVKEAQYSFLAVKKQLDHEQKQVKRKTRELFFLIMSSIKQLKAAQVALSSSKLALEAVKLGYSAGTRTTTDVLNARTKMFNSQLNLNKLKYQFLITSLSLKQVAGVLTKQDLVKISNMLVD